MNTRSFRASILCLYELKAAAGGAKRIPALFKKGALHVSNGMIGNYHPAQVVVSVDTYKCEL